MCLEDTMTIIRTDNKAETITACIINIKTLSVTIMSIIIITKVCLVKVLLVFPKNLSLMMIIKTKIFISSTNEVKRKKGISNREVGKTITNMS